MTVQPGVLALGTTDHCYLEFDRRAGVRDVVRVAAQLIRDLASTAGVNLVLGVRPSLWRQAADPADVPATAEDWTDDVVGPDGFTMPATQRDVWLWIAAGDRSAVFDASRTALAALRPVAGVVRETTGWLYRHDRDLTGFVDGTENPGPYEAPAVVAVPPGRPGEGSTIVLHQLWAHDTDRWESEPVDVQEKAMGRTKADSIELSDEDMPPDSHVARTVVEVDGEELDIFRRNVAYGGVTDHGTVFVGFSHDQWRMAEMLRRMAGVGDGVRCAFTRYVRPLTGAYYVVPSVEALVRIAGPAPDED
jgi:porphyrinogen peroxidase